MTVKISVIVPVYNPGSNIDDCVASLLRQTLPADEYEAIFVDDGSTDGTGERLDELAAGQRHISVIHIPNSGWPGRPRNVGIDAARGKYVFFIDNDDYINDAALERLYDFAESNGSDVVIGKVTGRGRRIPREIFRRNRGRAALDDAPLLSLLTPHKLFRKDFLDEHGIRFPEGRRRLEDHVFVLQAYFRAEVISVLADYVCYYWVRRQDRTNASLSRFDPQGYFDNLREVLDIVEANTDSGPGRDKLLRHWYRLKLLNRMGGRKFFAYAPDYRHELYVEIRKLAIERFGSGVVARLPMSLRVRSRLLRADRFDLLTALAETETGMKAQLHLESARWHHGVLTLRVSGSVCYADGDPVEFDVLGETLRWRLPAGLTDAPVEPSDLEVTKELRRSKVGVIIRSKLDRSEFVLPVDSKVRQTKHGDVVHASVVGKATLDPMTAAAGAALVPGRWDVVGVMTSCGWDLPDRVHAEDAAVVEASHAALVDDPPRAVVLRRSSGGDLGVEIDASARALVDASLTAGEMAFSAVRTGDEIILTVGLPVSTNSTAAVLPVDLALQPVAGGARIVVPASLVPSGDVASLHSRVPVLRADPEEAGEAPTAIAGRSGSWALELQMDSRRTALSLVLDVSADGEPSLRSTAHGRTDPPGPASHAGTAGAAVDRAMRTVRRYLPIARDRAYALRASLRRRRTAGRRR